MAADADGPETTDPVSQPFSIDEIKQLIGLMDRHELTELQIRDGEKEIRLARGGRVQPSAALPTPAAPASATAAASRPAPGTSEERPPEPAGSQITSPMVGTFYSAPSPEAEPYVAVGSRVEKDTVVCVIEAMKVFNEIKAELDGTIQEVLVENGTPVEYGQPLFLIEAT